MNYKLSKHAIDVMSSRNVKEEWVHSTLKNPSLIKKISIIEAHYFSKIEDRSWNREMSDIIGDDQSW